LGKCSSPLRLWQDARVESNKLLLYLFLSLVQAVSLGFQVLVLAITWVQA